MLDNIITSLKKSVASTPTFFSERHVLVILVAYLSVCLSTNVPVLTVVTGAPFGLYDFFINVTFGFYPPSSQQYKSEIVNDWEKTNIQEVYKMY